MTLPPEARPCAEASDNWLLLITAGRLELSHSPPTEGAPEGPPKVKRYPHPYRHPYHHPYPYPYPYPYPR